MNGRQVLGLAFVVLVWVLAVFTAPTGSVDVYVVLMLIGLLVVRELLGGALDRGARARTGVFVFLGGVAFVAIVVGRVRDILGV